MIDDKCPNRNEIPMMLLEINSGLSALLPDKMIDKLDEICLRCIFHVVFLTGAPQEGHSLAFVLTICLHSVYSTKDMMASTMRDNETEKHEEM